MQLSAGSKKLNASVLGAALAAATHAAPARAGGMELPVWGVHSMERAGALVAGADDADALWLDPAGIATFTGAGNQGLAFDVAYLYQPVQYTPADTTQGRVTNQQPGEPLPSLAGAIGIDDHWAVGGGVSWRYIPTSRYDDMGAARYASTGWNGSQFVQLTAGVGYKLSPQLRLGATIQDLVGAVDLHVVASGCPKADSCAGDVAYDMPLEIKETSAFSPSASLGVQYDASDYLTIGAMVQAPTRVSATGTLTLTVPAAPVFANMAQQGTQGVAAFWLPPAARAGVEYHDRVWSVEAAVDVEFWSLHDKLTIDPRGVAIGEFAASDMTIPRDYKTSVAVSLGGEVHLGAVQLGAGIGYETAAAPAADDSALTVDGQKLILGLGGGYSEGGWDIGAAASFVYMPDVTVANGQVPLLEPLHDAGGTPTIVNNGTYHAFDVMAGLRIARRFHAGGS